MTDHVGQQIGNYRLVRLLGCGGFAEVYLAEHRRLKTQAAIKLLSAHVTQAEEEEFLAEAKIIAHLEHPHIVRILDYEIQEGTPFLVMSYAPGGTLRDRHPKGSRLPLSAILKYLSQLAPALQYAHDARVIHRDMKPENMLLGRHGELLLSDFGIAFLAQSSHLQSTQKIVGTTAYMAPEQFQGKPRFASDQYALAIIVYEWLCGERPFQGTFLELYSQHLSVPPPSLQEKLPGSASEINNVIQTALAKDPAQRFASITAFVAALQNITQDEASRQITTTHSPSKRLQKTNELLSPIALPSKSFAEMPSSTRSVSKETGILPSLPTRETLVPQRSKPPRAVQESVQQQKPHSLLKRTSFLIALVSICLFLLFFFTYVFPTANVHLDIPSRPYRNIVQLILTESRSTASGVVTGKPLKNTFHANGFGTATGVVYADTKSAQGQVIFINNSTNVEIRIPTGSLVTTTQGIQFQTVADVVVSPKGGEFSEYGVRSYRSSKTR